MADFNELLNTLKQASVEAVDASKPVQVCFGKVITSSPLKILIDQKMTLDSTFLVLTRNVTNYKTTATISWSTNTKGSTGSGENSFASHAHGISGTKNITINNALNSGDEVILLRMQGGQKYIVLDKIG